MNIESLQAYGANTEEGIGRCMGSEDVYLELVGTIVEEDGFLRLKDALESQDLDAAFAEAHALKGVLNNLALTPLAEPICEMTELLRARTDMDYSVLLAKAFERWEELKGL